MRTRVSAFVAALALALVGVVPASAQSPSPTTVAFDLVASASQNLTSFVNPWTGAFASAGDGFEVYQRGVSASIPFALVDDSAGGFPPDELGIIDTDETDQFFGATDTENPDNTGPVTATWTFDVSGASGPLFLNVDAGAMGDFESSDTFAFAAGFDGAAPTTVLSSTTDEAGQRQYTLDSGTIVVLNDPLALGAVDLTNDLQTASAAIPGSGSSLVVTFTARTDGGSEAFAFDSLVITEDAPLGPVLEEPAPPECTGDVTLISEVQGPGATSPKQGQTVTIRGVVTLVSSGLGGFFIQEEPADQDANPATSEGLFVFAPNDIGDLSVGQTLALTDRVDERFGNTQMAFPAIAECPAAPVDIPPTPIVLPADDAARESLEGMLVVTAQDLFVTSLFTAYRFGELGVSLEGPLTQPTSAFEPGSPEAAALAQSNAEQLLFINDRDEFGNDNAPWFEAPDLGRAGDRVRAGVVGALNFSFGDFLLEPRGDFPDVEQVAGRPPAPQLPGGNDVVAFNVLNFFNTFGDSAVLRGAQSQEQFDVQSAKIVDAILALDAAVIGLIELENDYEDAFDGDPATEPSIQTLVDLLNDATAPGTYDWVRIPESQLTSEGLGGGGVGPDAIANGIIYQPARAEEDGDAATFDIDDRLTGEDPNKNRWPVAQTFEIDDEEVTVVVNHFKSKGSACDDVVVPPGTGDGQNDPDTGSCDLVREYAAERLLEWVATNPTDADDDDEDARVLLIGDFNSYEEEDPIEILVDAGYVDLVEELGGDAFTFKFDGRYGRLDYIFASPAAARDVIDAEVWQANSKEPYGYLYFNEPVDETAYASSDHDPVIVALRGEDDDDDDDDDDTDDDSDD